MKQTSTPPSTSVRMRAWAPFIAVGLLAVGVESKMVPGLRMPAGSNAALMRRMRASLAGSSSSRKYAFFSVPMPCSPEMAPPSAMPAREDGRACSRPRTSASAWNTDRCTLPSPAWPQPTIQRPVVAGRARPTAAMYAGIAARGTTMSMMSSAPLALATQNAFSRASISAAAAAGRQHVDVEGAELG